MRIVKDLSIIGLAGFLTCQGLYYLGEMSRPVLHAGIGILGLAAGVLMFVSLTHWVEHHKGR